LLDNLHGKFTSLRGLKSIPPQHDGSLRRVLGVAEESLHHNYPVFHVLSTQKSPACPKYQGESDDQHHSEQTNPDHIPTHVPTLHAISVHETSL
jgi:hypothetical protein